MVYVSLSCLSEFLGFSLYGKSTAFTIRKVEDRMQAVRANAMPHCTVGLAAISEAGPRWITAKQFVGMCDAVGG